MGTTMASLPRLGRPALLLVLAACSAATCGAVEQQPREMSPVQVEGVRNPMMRSYRAVSAGLDEFDDYRQRLAPAAPGLRFRARAGWRHPVAPDGLALRIATDDASYPVLIEAGGMFSVPRIEAAYAGDADLIFNRKSDAFRVDPEIRTPGLPDNVRRLGDLRLECRVAVAIGKKEMKFWQTAMVDTFMLTGDWCSKFGSPGSRYLKDTGFPFRSPSPLARATLKDGDRSVGLKVKQSGFEVPIGDLSWSNDALIELQYDSDHDLAARPAD